MGFIWLKEKWITLWKITYAIFDGHSGRKVAEYLQSNLFDRILSEVWTGFSVGF